MYPTSCYLLSPRCKYSAVYVTVHNIHVMLAYNLQMITPGAVNEVQTLDSVCFISALPYLCNNLFKKFYTFTDLILDNQTRDGDYIHICKYYVSYCNRNIAYCHDQTWITDFTSAFSICTINFKSNNRR
jgi:hypothetical protein